MKNLVRVIVVLTAFILTSCKTYISDQYYGDDMGLAAISLSVDAPKFSNFRLIYSTVGKDDIGYFSMTSDTVKYVRNDKEIAIDIAQLAPGDYEIISFEITYPRGVVARNIAFLADHVSIPFTVSPGQMSYLGNYVFFGEVVKKTPDIHFISVADLLSEDLSQVTDLDEYKTANFTPKIENISGYYFAAEQAYKNHKSTVYAKLASQNKLKIGQDMPSLTLDKRFEKVYEYQILDKENKYTVVETIFMIGIGERFGQGFATPPAGPGLMIGYTPSQIAGDHDLQNIDIYDDWSSRDSGASYFGKEYTLIYKDGSLFAWGLIEEIKNKLSENLFSEFSRAREHCYREKGTDNCFVEI